MRRPILQGGLEAVQRTPQCAVIFNQDIDLFLHHLLKQSGNILKVIIKGIPIDVAAVHDVLDCDFIQRAFFQKL